MSLHKLFQIIIGALAVVILDFDLELLFVCVYVHYKFNYMQPVTRLKYGFANEVCLFLFFLHKQLLNWSDFNRP